MRCPFCGESQLVEIHLTAQGRRVSMHSCPSCERRWWDSAEGPLGLGAVLEAVGAR
jgi:transposase-like protein